MENRDMEMARRIAGEVARCGGRTFFVGGLVRDILLGRDNQDVDIEVHGITPAKLEEILDGLGKRKLMGASFGIYGLNHYDLDISMPHSAEAESNGKQNFVESVDPFIGPEAAARRRDLTINALMQDVLTGEIVDFFGGESDLRNGIIRMVAPETFAEDPLRVLRAARFAARYGFRVSEETAAFCRTLHLEDMARERVFGELEKALMQSASPSVFFRELRAMNQLHTWFPEVENLIDVPQEPRFHPEGDVWNHTMLVLDQAAKLRAQAENPLAFMLAALCHDFGKTVATQNDNGRIRAIGHEAAGVPLAKRFLQRITKESALLKYVSNMVELHMRPNLMAAQHSSDKAFCRLFDSSCSPDDLLRLARADHLGRPLEEDYEPTAQLLQEKLVLFRDRMAQPYVKGQDLIELGFQPGPELGEALAMAHKFRLSGASKEESLRHTVAWLNGQKKS